MSRPSPTTGDERVTTSRRSIMRATGGTAAGVLGASLLGSARGAAPALDHLATEGNQIVDESGEAVQLHGATLIDPLRAQREWRGKTAEEMFALATGPDWPHSLVRIPCQPQDIAATLERGDSTATGSFIPHGDNWGPIKPGTFDSDDLDAYLDRYIDPLVDAARERGVYLMLDYHREAPVFHQQLYDEKRHRGVDYWNGDNDYGEEWCGPSTEYDWDWDVGMCGHRGVLWHGPDQIEDVKNIPHNQNKLNDPSRADPWFDPWCGADGGDDLLGQELDLFWSTVADRYGGDSDRHVVFDLFNAPTGPYVNDWAGPGRMPSNTGGYEITYDLTDPENGRPYWDLFLERATPWLNTVAEHAPERLVTVGSPRWSQFTYWAQETSFNGVNGTDSVTGVDSGATNVAYAAHAHVQEGLRPLSKYFGQPAELVPVVFTEFGWESGGGPDWETHLAGTTAVWGDGDPAALEEWGRPEGKPDPNELSESEKREMNYFGMGGDHYPPKEDYVGFGPFFENHPVHPIAGFFDHTWDPRFFADEHVTEGDWELNPREDTPGVWWQEYLADHADPNPPHWPTDPGPTDPDGDGRYEDLDGDGRVTFVDVNDLFQRTDTEAVQSQADYFDFSGDGRVDLQDVLTLFETV
ncbi:EF-hand domain-containing protein [Halococcoides cellulosivorans]|uniref:Glycoside hydrolase family 5 domain-containing protein n=1 Tax=Halococcoides cellulosivorans TaxID=1679096 RepID=A0A2R4WYU0_9EURY|nr:EF-hand domain-containing protein [Halococcoides cellulosivorans]AWB26708.1 hypothetical protein HARCEL1_02755 [Halococcoides cellulosivorans]